MSVLTPELLRQIAAQARLPRWGIHGVAHWARVREAGLRLAAATGANPVVVELFAVFHDACRWRDGRDPEHGRRGAELAATLRGALPLADADAALLRFACTHHTDGLTRGDVTVLTCWDADRLDLGRVGILPDPTRLCTEAARDPDLLHWAHRQACDDVRPPILQTGWGFTAEP